MLAILKSVRRFKTETLVMRQQEFVAIYAVNVSLYHDWIIKQFTTYFTRLVNTSNISFNFMPDAVGNIVNSKAEKKVTKLYSN